VQARIIQTFENAMSPAAIVRSNDNLAADHQLLLDIRSFEVVDTEPRTAAVELAAKIVGDGNRVLAAKVFTATAQVSSTDAKGAAAALDKAFGQVAAEMALWVPSAP
jgi:ABC-type uncharacterized transport system auxiliary subunit